MTLEVIQRDKILKALLEYRGNYTGSQADFCKMMEIHPSQFSSIKKAIKDSLATDRIISDDKLVNIGRKLGVNFSSSKPWEIVRTETFEYIYASLEHCQKNSTARIFCDVSDIGKTDTAKHYMRTGINVYYLDCSLFKGRTEFIRALARLVGVKSTNSLTEVIKDTIFMLTAVHKPLVILDEAGDLSYGAFLEIKGYWNALEGTCGWYMMGADGLAKKIQSGVDHKKVGYTEILRRFGGEYMSITKGMNDAQVAQFRKRQMIDVAEHNVPAGVDVKEVIKNTLSLTRVKENIRKVERQGGELFDQNGEAA